MRKKKIGMYIGVLLAIAIILFGIWNQSTLLAEMHKSVKQTGMIASQVGFILNDKDEVKISVKSSVTEGNALITLQNDNDEILYTFNLNCSQKETLSLEAGHYKIRIDSEQVKGNFDIVARK